MDNNLLLELSFAGIGQEQAKEIYRKAAACARQAVEDTGLMCRRLEVFFSTRRLTLWFVAVHTSRQKDAANELARRIMAQLAPAVPRDQVRGLVALYGATLLEANLHGVEAGRTTWIADKQVAIRDSEHYWRQLARFDVIVDNREREKVIRQLLAEGAAAAGGYIVASSQLLNWAVLENEQPRMKVLGFSDRFIALPQPLTLAVLEENRVFAVEDNDGNLLPWAVTIGHAADALEKALDEAEEMMAADMALPLRKHEEQLAATPFLPDLGTFADKAARLQKMVLTMAEQLEAGDSVLEVGRKASLLCKLDHSSQVCARYPCMRGIMAALLAQVAGEEEMVATAIREHSMPRGKLPRTLVGALLAVADRLDDLCGHYLCETSGHCHRRQLAAWLTQVVAILDKADLDLSLGRMIRFALCQYQSQGLACWRQRDLSLLRQMLGECLGNYLAEQDYCEKVVAALVAVEPDNVFTIMRRADLLSRKEQAGERERCSEVCKLLDKNCPRDYNYEEVAREFLEQPEEKELYEVLLVAREELAEAIDKRRYDRAIFRLAKIGDAVERFVRSSCLDTDDPTLKSNRLALLAEIRALFHRFADFSLF